MGFTICRNLHRNTAGWGGEDDRISTKKRLKNAIEPPIQAEIAPPPIPNSIFFSGGREGLQIPRQNRACGARKKVSGKSGFSCTPLSNPGYVTIHSRAFLSRICHCTNERRRREDRGAEGAERSGVWGGGVPLPSSLGVWGSVVSSPSGVRGGAPAANEFAEFYRATRRL